MKGKHDRVTDIGWETPEGVSGEMNVNIYTFQAKKGKMSNKTKTVTMREKELMILLELMRRKTMYSLTRSTRMYTICIPMSDTTFVLTFLNPSKF